MPLTEHYSVVVVGAGISGIDAARHLKKDCPDKSFVVLERRATYGGTWDLFKYPGVRSDSDMFTFGYGSRPWPSAKQIAPASDILEYLQASMIEFGVEDHIRYGHHIKLAAWSSSDAMWSLECENGAQFTCNFLFACTGYYQQDHGYEPEFLGRERFEGAGGQVVHPQKWDDDLVYAGKQVVVIGSGATAVTVVPAMAEEAAHVTMLQRSPTYIIPAPNGDSMATGLGKVFPSGIVHPMIRWRNVLATKVVTEVLSRRDPVANNKFVIGLMRKALPKQYMSRDEFKKHFTPWYNIGEQRPCLDPDAAFFESIKNGKASIVTDHIQEFDETGIVLKSGERLDCDIVVTATGLVLQQNQPMATMEVTVDGTPYVARDHMVYKGCMLSGVPNFAFIIGYFNASWTLKADITCGYVCRVIKNLDHRRAAFCCPDRGDAVMADAEDMLSQGSLKISSGYLTRALDRMPRVGLEAPWTPLSSYMSDKWVMNWKSIEDGVLRFEPKLFSRL